MDASVWGPPPSPTTRPRSAMHQPGFWKRPIPAILFSIPSAAADGMRESGTSSATHLNAFPC
ncbi:hypothetical protein AZA_70964 [Nitrospirillum viridazoti Y2]|nr:hypothetical protein AZA_70964 [Nitrospirillum amazonense Y2]